MRFKQLTAVATLLAALAAVGIVGCRKGPAPHNDATSLSANPLLRRGMTPASAKKWEASLSGLAVSASGTPWAVGKIFRPFDFGSGLVNSTGGADVLLTRLDPATNLATATFTFGAFRDNAEQPQSQVGTGVAVASSGNVGVIGSFKGEIDFTANNSDGSGPSLNPGSAGLDFLVSASSVAFYSVFDGASTGTYVTPKKVHMVDVGTGALLSIASNPNQNAFAICGKTSKAVPDWSDSGASKGVITGGNAVAGGETDVVVAKIDAATGDVIWGKQFGGAGNQGCESVAIDNNGDVIIAGTYGGTLSFGGSMEFPAVATNFLGLVYVAKLEATTGAAIAAKTWGKAGRSSVYGVAVDASSHIVVAGRLEGDVDFGGGASITKRGLTDAFVVRLTAALEPVWAWSSGDIDCDQNVSSVGVSSRGDVFIAGSFEGKMAALGLTAAGATSRTGADIFTAKLAAADGAVLSAHAYGDGRGTQTVNTVTVARAAKGSLADSMFIGGSFASDITLESTTLSTGSANVRASYIARLIP
jgi:hypothetical protein